MELLTLLVILVILYWFSKTLSNIKRGSPADIAESSPEVAEPPPVSRIQYREVDEQKVLEKRSTRNWFLLGGAFGVIATWLFNFLIALTLAPQDGYVIRTVRDFSEYFFGAEYSATVFLCLSIPIGFLLGGSGGVVGLKISKNMGLGTTDVLFTIIGGMALAFIIGGPILMVVYAFFHI